MSIFWTTKPEEKREATAAEKEAMQELLIAEFGYPRNPLTDKAEAIEGVSLEQQKIIKEVYSKKV